MPPEWSEEDLVMVSALEHWSYCERQCYLIHVEQVYDENLFTLRGSASHERADEPLSTVEDGIRVERALPIWCDRLGLIGKADVVEFHGEGIPYPVEQKLGARRGGIHDALQLCAQALCLEEMFEREVPAGAIFSRDRHRRREMMFTQELRTQTEHAIVEVRQMIKEALIPLPVNDKRCPDCSLINACMPEAVIAASDPTLRQRLIRPAREAENL